MMVAIYLALGLAGSSGLALLVGSVIRWWAPLDAPDALEEERRRAVASTYLEGP